MSRGTAPSSLTAPEDSPPATPHFGKLRLGAVILLTLAGLGLTLYLFIWGNEAATGCGDAGCASVMASRWSRWMGLPVSALAAAVYATLLFATPLTLLRSHRPLASFAAWTTQAGAVALAGAALWFLGLLTFHERTFCAYCVSAHAIGLTLALLIGRPWLAWPDPSRPPHLSPNTRRAAAAIAAGLAAVAALVGGQLLRAGGADSFSIMRTAPEHAAEFSAASSLPYDSGAGDARRITIRETNISFSPTQMPMIGSPQAPILTVLFFDYTCETCQKLHRFLIAAVERYQGQLGVILAPAPVRGACNPLPGRQDPKPYQRSACAYARLSLALWKADPAQWTAFDRWLTEPQAPPPIDFALGHVEELVGKESLERALRDPWPAQQIDRDYRFPQQVTASGSEWTVPWLATGRRDVVGCPDTQQQLFQVLEHDLGLKPPALFPQPPFAPAAK